MIALLINGILVVFQGSKLIQRCLIVFLIYYWNELVDWTQNFRHSLHALAVLLYKVSLPEGLVRPMIYLNFHLVL
jgi:hypothetical protein